MVTYFHFRKDLSDYILNDSFLTLHFPTVSVIGGSKNLPHGLFFSFITILPRPTDTAWGKITDTTD